MLVGSMALQQASTVLSSYWLVWWQTDNFNQTQSFYMVSEKLGTLLTRLLTHSIRVFFFYFREFMLRWASCKPFLHFLWEPVASQWDSTPPRICIRVL